MKNNFRRWCREKHFHAASNMHKIQLYENNFRPKMILGEYTFFEANFEESGGCKCISKRISTSRPKTTIFLLNLGTLFGRFRCNKCAVYLAPKTSENQHKFNIKVNRMTKRPKTVVFWYVIWQIQVQKLRRIFGTENQHNFNIKVNRYSKHKNNDDMEAEI